MHWRERLWIQELDLPSSHSEVHVARWGFRTTVSERNLSACKRSLPLLAMERVVTGKMSVVTDNRHQSRLASMATNSPMKSKHFLIG